MKPRENRLSENLRNCSEEVREEPGYIGSFCWGKRNLSIGIQNIRLINKQTSQVNDFSAFLCRRSCKCGLIEIILFFLFVVNFVIHWNGTAMGLHVFPIPIPPSHLPLHPLPLGFPSAPGPNACLMHPTWAGDLFHPRYCTCFNAVLLKHPTLSFSHRV